jgi:hypothetical protein
VIFGGRFGQHDVRVVRLTHTRLWRSRRPRRACNRSGATEGRGRMACLAVNPAQHGSLPRARRPASDRPEPWTWPELAKWLRLGRRDRFARNVSACGDHRDASIESRLHLGAELEPRCGQSRDFQLASLVDGARRRTVHVSALGDQDEHRRCRQRGSPTVGIAAAMSTSASRSWRLSIRRVGAPASRAGSRHRARTRSG